MKILVIGATGLTGQLLLKHLLEGGHEVTAFVRDPSKLALKNARLQTAQGEARDAASLDRAVKGQDAVISAFGPRSIKQDDLQEAFMRNLVAAMTENGVKRFINLSALGAGDSYAEAPFVMRKVILPLFLKNVFADKNKGEVLLVGSSLDYTNVRPGRLTNGRARGGVKASLQFDGLKPLMTREDLALFMVAQLGSSEWVRKSPLIGY